MTIKDLLEQMKINWETYHDGDGFVKHISFNEEQFDYLIKEVEILIRKETIEEILAMIQDEGFTGVINGEWHDIISTKEIKEFALSNGIKLD